MMINYSEFQNQTKIKNKINHNSHPFNIKISSLHNIQCLISIKLENQLKKYPSIIHKNIKIHNQNLKLNLKNNNKKLKNTMLNN